MSQRRLISILNRASHQKIAQGVPGKSVQLFEGAWYFERTAVDFSNLIITERTYTCPYKGICYWIDVVTPDGIIPEAAFTYFEVKPGYKFIHNKIGFYAGVREATVQETAVLTDA